MTRLLLVDDHPVVRAGFARLLEHSGGLSVVGEAGDAAGALSACDRLAPQLIVTDLALPDGGGLDLVRRLVARGVRVLCFSMHDSATLAQRALDAGACGYVTKRSAPQVLVDAVRAVSAGRRYVSADIAAALDAQACDSMRARLRALSAREIELLRLLASGRGSAECARGLGVSAKTVSNYQWLIKEKLGAGSLAELIRIALDHGLTETP